MIKTQLVLLITQRSHPHAGNLFAMVIVEA
jgi:hypothetical protein